MGKFIHWIRLFVRAPLVHLMARLCVTPLSMASSITLLVSLSLLIFGPSASSPCVTALSMKRLRHDVSTPSHDFLVPCKLCLTPCAGDLTAGSHLTGWQAIQIATLLGIVPVHPGASQARTYKTESVGPNGVAEEPNYNILSEWISYYSRYATKKKCVMLGFSLLQLVTSKPRAIAIPEAQPTQSLPYSFHVPATWHGTVSVYLAPTKYVSASDHH
jgi:hypothetical protein